MARLDHPLRFRPFLRPMVWGGRALGARLGKPLANEGPFGESWETSDHATHASVPEHPNWAGDTLRSLMASHRDDLLGPAASGHAVFPWLVKFLDCHDWLSVQVHPDRDVVKVLRPGEGSKTEAWYILHAEPGSRVYAGLKPGVGPNELREALARGTVADTLHAFAPRAGDCVFLPAGTVHAVGGGVLMAEIQETSDVTFRLYDWDRVDAEGNRRALHIEESFASIRWDYGPVTPVRAEAETVDAGQPLVRCPYFTLDRVKARGPQRFRGGQLQCLIVVAGTGRWDDGQAVAAGQTWILPAALARAALTPAGEVEFLHATLPG